MENSENSNSIENSENDEAPDDSFFELIMKCQGTRIDQQRTFLPNFDLGSPQSELHLGDSQLCIQGQLYLFFSYKYLSYSWLPNKNVQMLKFLAFPLIHAY